LSKINHKDTKDTKQGLPLRRNNVCPSFNPPDIQSFLRALCVFAVQKKEISQRIQQCSWDPDLSGQCGGGKTPLWIRCWKDQPGSLGTEKKPIVFRSIGVMQSVMCLQYLKWEPALTPNNLTIHLLLIY